MSEEVYSDFCNKVALQIADSAPTADTCSDHLKQSLVWTTNIQSELDQDDCDLLLNGCYGSAIEAVSLLSFGLVTPSILALRSHYELSLMYIYYKDHPVEWRNTQEYRARPKLPGEVKKYLRDNYPRFDNRWKGLIKVKERAEEDCYDILSGVAHGTALNSISTANEPRDIIETTEIVQQATSIFKSVSECINDINISCFEGSWVSLPDDVRAKLELRFGEKNPISELEL